MVLKHIKICSVLLIKREMQMKNILSYHISPPKLIKDWKFHSILCWHSREEVSTLLHFWWIKNGTRKRIWQYPSDYPGMCSLTSNSMPRDLSPGYTAKYMKSWICTRLSCKAVIVKKMCGVSPPELRSAYIWTAWVPLQCAQLLAPAPVITSQTIESYSDDMNSNSR